MSEVYTVKVEEGRSATSDGMLPSVGPVYRCIYAKDGLLELPSGLESPWDFFSDSAKRNPNNPMLGKRQKLDSKVGPYSWLTYKEVYDAAIQMGSAMKSCGVNPGDQCGIYGANCPEWIIAMEACNSSAVTYVPLYDTLGPNAVEFIINHAEVSIAFVQENKIPSILSCLDQCSSNLKTIVSFGNVSAAQKKEAEEFGTSCFSWGEFLQLGSLDWELPPKKKTDICTIMYTSGTTGDPKGVLISNESIITLLAAIKQLLACCNEHLHEKDVYLSYLPLAHIFDRIVEEAMIWHGASIGFWRGDVKLLMEDIAELKPTIFVAVPRVLDRVYTGLTQRVSTGNLLKQTMFNIAYTYKLHNMSKGQKHDAASPLFDKIIFNKVKQALGGSVRIVLSGAAPLSKHVEGFMRVVTCAHILQGYGLTETCAGTFVSLPNENDMLGTVGPPVPYVDVCLESVPEMGYDALATPARGEICVKGSPVFSGYYKREDLTKEVMIDGWFHTGDVGEWLPNGTMKIIDRKKNIFKLSQGEYVAVENLENIYVQVPAIESIWIYGNSFEYFLVAIINPSKVAIEAWAAQTGINMDYDDLCEDSRTKSYILGELAKIAKEKKLKGFEFIKTIHLDPVPFDMERDLTTPTFKKKRPQLLKYYQSVINEMYQKGNKPSA